MISALERIRIRPEIFITKLVGDPGYKLRVGDYRIIMDIDRNELIILVIKVAHQKNIYNI
jgi:mRNA interferase RelE/StbE